MTKVLLSVLGPDQPGIIAAVAGAITARQGNIENVSQTLLQSVFGALLIVSLPEGESPQALKESLQEACRGLQLFIHLDKYQAPALQESTTPTQPYIITALGPDRRGLVAAIASVLAEREVNITNMQALFKGGNRPLDNLMMFEVDVPRQVDMSGLRAALGEISARLSLEINIQHRGIFDAVSRIQN